MVRTGPPEAARGGRVPGVQRLGPAPRQAQLSVYGTYRASRGSARRAGPRRTAPRTSAPPGAVKCVWYVPGLQRQRAAGGSPAYSASDQRPARRRRAPPPALTAPRTSCRLLDHELACGHHSVTRSYCLTLR
ncbi:unnamed protein product [Arctia plantaginis]|uniref:Uncharacterized protein n=1 Tax=Arctia plantaginis TaxID=874455 RepID=A0A8S0ZL15_ARCPL|nr:unnamed protein product [Arctia plantaginis]